MFKALLILSIGISAFASELTKPDPNITFGDTCSKSDPDFVGYRYKEKVAYCVRNVSQDQKAKIYVQYEVPAKCREQYTIDHFIPLALGGSNKPQNLWPEHHHVKATRQNLEQDLFEQIQNGEISQEKAIAIIRKAKMNPDTPKPWKCGVSPSDQTDVATTEDSSEDN